MKKARVFWFTGLSGAGKSTVAALAETELSRLGVSVFVLDGDAFRATHSRHLGFSEKDIQLNNEMIADHCVQLQSRYDVILVPIISPYRVSRAKAREKMTGFFDEVYFEAGIDCLIARDTKGLYRKARNRELTTLIGYSDSNPYEAPILPDLVLKTETETPEESAARLVRFVAARLTETQTKR